MELIDLLRVVRRWVWLIIAVVVVTELALWLGTQFAEPVYAATVSLQISAPQRESVAAYDEYRSIALRDEITVAINNFVELLQSDDVRQRTINQLDLNDKDGRYTVATEQVRDADFVNITVEAGTPGLAAEIANTHVGFAITYYGELRSKSTNAEKELFAEQLQIAEKEYHAAENTLADFRGQNGIYSLEGQLSTQQELLERLQLERDQRLLEQATAIGTTTESAISFTAATATPVIDPVAEVDKLIAQRMKELDQFTALAPQYNVLVQNVEQARAVYQHLLGKYSEAELKVTAVQAANFIQVIKPAYAPVGPESSWPKLAVLALAGSLGLGVMLAFLLQYITSFRHASVVAPVHDHKTPSHKRHKKATQGRVPVVPMSETKTSWLEHAIQRLWNHLRNILRWNRRSYEHTELVSSADPAEDQSPVAVQSQHGSAETKVA
jgi:uncharacterized protein involved in exopolysaccharide biosynthesis